MCLKEHNISNICMLGPFNNLLEFHIHSEPFESNFKKYIYLKKHIYLRMIWVLKNSTLKSETCFVIIFRLLDQIMTAPHTTRVTESQVQKRVHDKRETLQKNKKNYLT